MCMLAVSLFDYCVLIAENTLLCFSFKSYFCIFSAPKYADGSGGSSPEKLGVQCSEAL